MEAELFGTEPRNGAARRVGALEEAHGGTLYLDEIADMPRETQNKILRVLVDQTFERVGGATKVKVDVRVLSSTARDLESGDPGGPLPRGPLPPPERRAAARSRAGRAARGHPRAGRLFHGAAVELDRPAAAQHRRRRDGGAAGARLAGQPPPAPQQRRAADDPDARRSGGGHHRRHAAEGDRRDPAVHARRRAARTSCRCRSARRARCSSANI